MKGPPLLLAAIVALGLVVWAIFYALGMPLNPAEAVVVVGLCGAIAYGVQAAVRHRLHRKAPPGAHAPAGAPHDAHRSHAKPKAGHRAKKKRH